MLNSYLKNILGLYKRTSAVLITDRNGFIEYSTMISDDINNFKNAEVTGEHILDVYPSLNTQTSSVMRVLRTGKPIIDEHQIVTNYKGEFFHLMNSTFPIIVKDEIIGTIEASVYIDESQASDEPGDHIKRKRTNKELYTLDDIITNHPALLSVKKKVRRIAVTPSSVLIQGETGTGKELVAQSIHSHSHRSNGQFISQNCAAIPVTLLESILFGTAKGSFTHAEDRKGLFELANGGTIFLDELNSMDISLQSKILKVIEDKEVRKIGDAKTIPIDVRILSAVNEDPVKLMENNRLREDLYYRLGVVQITLPPLRERVGDIPLLTNYFIQKYNSSMRRNITGLSSLVSNLFETYSWPGNVRELQNTIEGCFNIAESKVITMKDLPEFLFHRRKTVGQIAFGDENASLAEKVDAFEKDLILQAVKSSRNLVEAAKKLKISRQSLQYKMGKYQLL